MPIPFLEALRDWLAPVFNGTVPLEREKEERGSKEGPGGVGEGRSGGDKRHKHTTSAR